MDIFKFNKKYGSYKNLPLHKMLKKKIFYNVAILSVLFIQSCEPLSALYEEGKAAAFETFNSFQHMFISCATSPMPDQHLRSDDLKNFVNYPPKTTVGVAPKLTSNRKYFANLISSTAFKTMLAQDEEEIRRDMVKKLKYCDQVIMDVNVLKEFYDREIDLTKV